MALVAFVMVLVSAVGHAVWNFLAKTALKTEAFILWMLVIRTLFIAPFFALGVWSAAIPLPGLAAASVSAALWVGYFGLLSKSYEREDFSVIYPIARSFPIFVPIWAVSLLGERLSWIGIAGIFITSLGTYLLQMRNPAREFFEPLRALRRRGPLMGLMAAVLASLATVIDKWGVNVSTSSSYTLWSFLILALAYTPIVLKGSGAKSILSEWLHGRRSVILGGFFGSFYALILWALPIAQVSYVQAVRQISIVLGAAMGIRWLHERHGAVRLASSALIFLGVVAIGLS